jgi:hypothetical protein
MTTTEPTAMLPAGRTPLAAELTWTGLLPGDYSVKLNGAPVEHLVHAFALEAEPGELPRLVLQINLVGVHCRGDVEVDLPAETRTLLERAGWTPPAGGGQ